MAHAQGVPFTPVPNGTPRSRNFWRKPYSEVCTVSGLKPAASRAPTIWALWLSP